MERPCKRCKQNGLEDSCVDLPRKKRVSKKRKTEEQEQTQTQTQTQAHTQPQQHQVRAVPATLVTVQAKSEFRTQETMQPPATPHQQTTPQRWDDASYRDFFTPPEGFTPSALTPSALFAADLSQFQTEAPTYVPDYPDEFRSPVITPSITGVPSTPREAQRAPPPPSEPTVAIIAPPPTALSHSDIVFLFQQIVELKENNKQLEKKLAGVTSELGDIKSKPTIATVAPPNKANNQPALQPSNNTPNLLSPWHTFQPQTDLAISVWKNMGYSKNILVECNHKFLELLGYPIEVLKNDFSCSRLIQNNPDEKKDREYPMRTQIVTANGLKDVFLTINPVADRTSVKYYVLHILEVHS